MAISDFKVIEERRLGSLNPEQRKVWSKLVARRKRLEASQQLYEEEVEFFVDAVLADVVQENHPAVKGVHVTDEGLLLQAYCACYRCQVILQNLPAAQVVEAMIAQGHIPKEHVSGARKWAAAKEPFFALHMN